MTLSGRRIAVVLASLELGGAERQAVLLATHLARDHGAEVAVFGMGREGAGAALCRRAGLPCTAVPLPVLPVTPIFNVLVPTTPGPLAELP